VFGAVSCRNARDRRLHPEAYATREARTMERRRASGCTSGRGGGSVS